MFNEIRPLGSFDSYKYVVVLSEYEGKLLLSRHRRRTTWETQGGHIEPGETPMDAAKRELYEESGAADFDIRAVFDYRAGDRVAGQPERAATGVVFFARIRALGPMPDSEMAEVCTFDSLPENVTYPGITPHLFAEALRMGLFTDLSH